MNMFEPIRKIYEKSRITNEDIRANKNEIKEANDIILNILDY